MTTIETPVLIVGGGGAGLTASMLLSKLGVESQLVSALPTTSILPKAHVLNQRAMEILTDAGVAEEIYARGTPAENMRHTAYYAGFTGPDPVYGRQIGRLECWGAGGLDTDWASASPCLQANLPQIRLEPILKRGAEALAPGRVRFHHELVDFAQDAEGVTATVLDKDSGDRSTIRARYLLACDGGRTVGPRLGVKLEGPRDLFRVASVYMSADLSRWAGDPDVLIRWIWLPELGVMGTLVPMGPDHWGPDSEEWIFHLNYENADMRALEDGAHRRRVLAAIATQSMEFREHAVEFGYEYTSSGVIPDGTPAPPPLDPIRVYVPSTRPGAPLPHAWLEDLDGRRVAIGQLVRPGRFLLIASEEGHAWCEAAAKLELSLDAVRIGHLDGDYRDPRCAWLRRREIGARGAVLVRPDRFVAWRSLDGSANPAAALGDALARILERSS